MEQSDIDIIKKLIEKPAGWQFSEEEARLLYNWIQSSEENKELYIKIRDIDTYMNIVTYIESQQEIPRNTGKLLKWIAIAATFILLVTSSWMAWEFKDILFTSKKVFESSNDVLLISGEKTYNLSKKLPGSVAVNQAALSKLLDLQNDVERAAIQEYTIIVPKGKLFEITFTDGSYVMLNAGSELKFPSGFSDNERVVSLAGEALFRIAKDEKKPFFVRTGQGKVEVLGTQFNIKSYPDLPYEVISLLEGRVEVSNDYDKQVLNPGEQATLKTSKITVDLGFDQEEILAWKEGVFMFNNKPLEEVLRHVERWYNVQFKYSEEDIKALGIYIKIRKDRPVDDLFKALETTNKIRFEKTEGTTIYVTPYQFKRN